MVQTAVWMLAVATALSFLLTLSGYARAGLSTMLQFAPFALVTALLFVGVWVAVILMITRRQSAAKFLATGLIVWTSANLLLAFAGLHWAGLMQGTMILTWIIFAARIIAVGLLFTPESNSWFSSGRR